MTIWEIIARMAIGAGIMLVMSLLWVIFEDEVSAGVELFFGFCGVALLLGVAFFVGYFALVFLGVQ